MTNQEIQAIRERVEKAIDGPWKRGTDGEKFIILANEEAKVKGWKYRVIVESLPTDGEDEELEDQEHYNTDFITHAREDVPKLIATVDGLTGEIDQHLETMNLQQEQIERLRKENEFLRFQRESLESQLQHYRGYE